MYFDRWYRGMATVGVLTAGATLVALRATSAPRRNRWRTPAVCAAVAVPAIAVLRGVEATVVHLAWSVLLALAFARGRSWPRVLAVNLVLAASLFSIYECSTRARDVGRRTAEMGWNLAPPAPGDPWLEWRNSEWMSWRDDADAISRAWRVPVRSPLAEGVMVSRGIAAELDERLVMQDHAGFFIRVSDGRRVTVGAASNSAGVLSMFGGSTVACLEVLDHLTIPSLLQRELRLSGQSIRVRNYGVPGARVVHQVALLRATEDVGPGDVIVFFDGNNDALHIKESAERNPAQFSVVERTALSGLRALERRSRVFFNAFLSSRLLEWRMGTVSDEGLAREAQAYAAAVQEARSFAEARGARFLHVMQPSLFTYRDPGNVGRLGTEISRIRRALLGALSPGLDVDAASAMDGLEGSPYLDWMHVTSAGNGAVAQLIARELER